MIQITKITNELSVVKKLFPLWKKYSDKFIFYVDYNNKEILDYLNDIKFEYNIIDIVHDSKINIDKYKQQYDKILLINSNEYLDGSITKDELESMMENNSVDVECVFYTSSNTIRIDDCISERRKLISKNTSISLDKEILFLASIEWLDKNYSAISQYFNKVNEYLNKSNVNWTKCDEFVNDFNWNEEYYSILLKIEEDTLENILNKDNIKLKYILETTNKFSIPNLGDWGMEILNSIPMYFCTASDEKHFQLLLNMIGSVMKFNFYNVVQIDVYDIGLTKQQINELENIKKVKVYDVEKVNSRVLEDILTAPYGRRVKGAFSWKPPIIKNSLDRFPYLLYLDAGTAINCKLNNLFKHIIQNGYWFTNSEDSVKEMCTTYVIDKFKLNSEENKWILEDDVCGIDAGCQGISRKIYDNYVIPMYELSKDIQNFIDDGTSEKGYGQARHDQALFSITARQLKLNIFELKYHADQVNEPLFEHMGEPNCELTVDMKQIPFIVTHNPKRFVKQTNIFRCRWNHTYETIKLNYSEIKRNYIISCITPIGSLDRYEIFIDQYFSNIQEQINFNRIEFIILYKEWSKLFEKYLHLKNVRFIKEEGQGGQFSAWNQAISNTSSEYISNWNIDDMRFPINNKIKYDLLFKNINIDLVYNYYVALTPKQLEEKIDLYSIPIQQYPDNFHLYVKVCCMAGPDPMWRKSSHMFVGFFDTEKFNYVGDWEMWIRMAMKGLKFKLIPEILCIYLEHDATDSKVLSWKRDAQTKLLAQTYNFNI